LQEKKIAKKETKKISLPLKAVRVSIEIAETFGFLFLNSLFFFVYLNKFINFSTLNYMVNKVTLIGRLGKNPEARALENGVYITKFRLATDESYKDKNGAWQTLTEWHSVVMWRDLAERAERLLKKGYLVYIEGKLTNTTWKDENGINRYRTEVKASHFRLLSSEFSNKNKSKENSTAQEPKENPFIVKVTNGTDDLPF